MAHRNPTLKIHWFAAVWLVVLLAACGKDPAPLQQNFADMTVPQSFGWGAIRNFIITVNLPNRDGQIFDLLDLQNNRIDRQLIRDGKAVFNVRVSAELPALRLSSPVSGQVLDFPAANTTINFDLNANSVAQWNSAADADGDSIPDPWDEFPNDPALAIRLFLPYQGQHIVLFDEGWPFHGDFDFNDLVIGHRFELLYDARRSLVQGTARLKVLAHSLTEEYGLAIEYLRAIAGTTYDYAINTSIFFEPGGPVMHDSSLNTAYLIPDLRTWLNPYYSNNGTGPMGSPQELVYSFRWNDTTGGNYPWPNFYLFKPTNTKSEVHVFGYPPTQHADLNLLSTGDDASIRRWRWNTNFTLPNAFYRSYQNFPWGVEFFENSWRPTREGNQLSEAYPYFVRWAETGGELNRSWRQFPDVARTVVIP